MKKTVAILTVVLMLLGGMSSALAARPVCSVYGCTKTRNHTHNGRTYAAHHAEDGHYYHQCGLAGCSIAEPHNHNDHSGSYQGGHHTYSGHGSRHSSGHGGRRHH